MIYVFAGPSLSHDVCDNSVSMTLLPPAKKGDLYQVALGDPGCTLVLIDGVFGVAPSVWHKEIVWCLQHQHRVIGAASMGALRAAELASYGMEGVGEIYNGYSLGTNRLDYLSTQFLTMATNVLTSFKIKCSDLSSDMIVWLYMVLMENRWVDDDDVAVVHAPVECGAQAVTIPMVDIVYNLRAYPLSLADKASIALKLKSIHYKDRTQNRCHEELKELSRERAEPTIATFFRNSRISQKHADALAAIRVALDASTHSIEKRNTSTAFRKTSYWRTIQEAV